MKIQLAFLTKRRLEFKVPAGTSRGVMNFKDAYFIHLVDEQNNIGIGECSTIPGLSFDDRPDYLQKLIEVIKDVQFYLNDLSILNEFPSIVFGLETAYFDLFNGGQHLPFPSEFTKGNKSIPINGLIWMGNEEEMMKQIESKLQQNFKCIKLKIGAIDFERELKLIGSIRERYDEQEIEIRVDANGAFGVEEAMSKLEKLSKLKLHSIEQPIAAGNWSAMKELCKATPMPIALDEELIGLNAQNSEVIEAINPQYIILKPSLHGGIAHCNQWIQRANDSKVGWWITSALESNIGLNAIAQWAFTLNSSMYQGLGTGQLYTNNINSPLEIEHGHLQYNPQLAWGEVRNLDI